MEDMNASQQRRLLVLQLGFDYNQQVYRLQKGAIIFKFIPLIRMILPFKCSSTIVTANCQ